MNLKSEDIDAERKIIHIKGAKGRKDRDTILLDVAPETLGLYLKMYQSEKWLFPEQKEGLHITTRTVHKSSKTTEIYMQVSNKYLSKIKKPVRFNIDIGYTKLSEIPNPWR